MTDRETLSIEEYTARAVPRLARLDAIAERCAFGKWEFQCTPEERRYREIHQRLLDDQTADEVAAGL